MKIPIFKSGILIGLFAMGILVSLGGKPVRTEHLSTDDFYSLPTLETAASSGLAPAYESQAQFVSEVFEADFPFQLLGLNWQEDLPEATDVHLEIRFRTVSGDWTDWEEIERDQDGAVSEDLLQTYVITENSDAFQYRALLLTEDTGLTPKLSEVSFDYVNGGKESLASRFNQLARLTFSDSSDLISRNEWGANEDLRLAKNYSQPVVDEVDDKEEAEISVDVEPGLEIVKTVSVDANGNDLWWELEYPRDIKKIIIHHTATSGSLDDPKAAIRAIYHYHSITRNWGDIGYNYIIDANGKIYEGRYGGDGVVAGHTSGYNTGTVGIALLGNFENEPLPAPMMKSLMGLIYEKAELHGIDPDASGLFHGKVIQNILGHRDLGATACPGAFTYDYMDELRKSLGAAMDNRRHTNTSLTYAYEELGDRELITLSPNTGTQVTIQLKNTGTTRWNSGTFLTVNANTEAEAIASIQKDATKSIAKMKESFVDPGGTATFTFPVVAQMNGGLAHFDLAPVFNGIEKASNVVDLAVFVEQSMLRFSVDNVSLSARTLKPGQTTNVVLKIKNTGNLTWKNSGTNAVSMRRSGDSVLTSLRTLASLKETEVKPGAFGTFEFSLTAPNVGGTHSLYFTLEMANSNAITSKAGSLSLEVLASKEDATILGNSNNFTFKPGENKALWISIQNSSASTWYKTGTVNIFELGITKPLSVITSTPKLSVSSLAAGRSARVLFTVTAPEQPGTYTLSLRPRLSKRNLTAEAYNIVITVEDSGASLSTNSANYENPIRIKLTPEPRTDAILTSASNFSLYDGDKLIKNFVAKSRLRVLQSGAGFKATSGSSTWTLTGPVRLIPTSNSTMQILTMDQRPAWNLTLNDNEFRGTIEIRNIKNEITNTDEFTIINELALEDYIKGVGEISNGDPTEKIKTILVLARSYAWYYMTVDEKFPGQPYDLDDDPNTSQKYLGYGYEKRSPNVNAAADSTRGKIVTYNGTVVKTPYFSKSDGTFTKSAKDVWGWTNTPWLVSVSDSYCTSSTKFEGHGVGASGCGATQMALLGKKFDEIIKYYFTGVSLGSI